MTGRPPSQNIGVATVTSEDFLPGTLVMLNSFLAHNRWFRGDITVIHHDLGEPSITLLADCFPQVIMHAISDPMIQRLNQVADAVPWIGSRMLQFGSLEILSFVDHDRVLFFDSDLLFVDSIEELLAVPEPLICCGDGAFYRGNMRSRDDFSELPRSADNGAHLPEPFNSGFLILSDALLSDTNYQTALAMITADRWQSDATGHTDQMIFNLLFAGEQKLVSPIYNFALTHRDIINQSSGVMLQDAKVLHFTGAAKPWMLTEIFRRAHHDPAIIAAFQMWHDSFVDFMTRRKLKTMINH